MKLLSIILQTTKGQLLLIVTSNCFSLITSVNYSHIIYQFIIDSYKNNLRVQRSFPLTTDHYCISNVTKDFFLSIIVSKNDLMLGYDGLRKLSQYFNRNIRIDTIMKKIVELFGALEQFLYCRELPLGELVLPVRPDRISKKRRADFQILNRFSHIHVEPQKRAIVEIQLKHAKIQEIYNNFRSQVVKSSRNFCIKVFEQQNISTDVVKENFIINYKNRLFSNSFVTRRPQPLSIPAYEQQMSPLPKISKKQEELLLKKKQSQQSTNPLLPSLQILREQSLASQSTKIVEDQSDILFTEEQKTQKPQQQAPKLQLKLDAQMSFMDIFNAPFSPRPSQLPLTSRQNNSSTAKVRMSQKLQLVLLDQKVKNVNQYGQVAVEVNALQKVSIMLVSPNWLNNKQVVTRITPNSFKTKLLQPNIYEVQIDEACKSKGVIDYIINKQTFNYNKIPLMFISSYETRKNSKQNIIEFTFKYKINDKWKGSLHDIDIQVVLDPNLIFSDCKTNPLANSLKGKTVNWKAKELTQNAKGKLSLALYDPTIPPKDIIRQTNLSMRAEKSLLPDLDVEFVSFGGTTKNKAKKHLVIQYKILPK